MDFLEMGLETAKTNPAKASQLVKTVHVDPDEAKTVLGDIKAKYPNLEYNEAAVKGSLMAPTGGRVVVTAAKQRNPGGGFTYYYNGKLVLVGALAEFAPATAKPARKSK